MKLPVHLIYTNENVNKLKFIFAFKKNLLTNIDYY
jgi:hypothetical protein